MQILGSRNQGLLVPSAILLVLSGAVTASAIEATGEQEYYELRVYRVEDGAKQKIVSDYLEQALVPALNRMGIERVGVFTRTDDDQDHSIYVLIPYPTLTALAELNNKLSADSSYQKAAADYFAQPKKDPAYTRIESRLMKAFSGMPVMELPEESVAKKPRIFELRTYESHNEDAARSKVDMFNSGEIQIMRDVKLAPVFYGEMLVGDDVPNLTYMLSAPDMDAHQEHWQGFRVHPEWQRMKAIEKYKGTVSQIRKWFLAPTAFSQI